MVTTNIQSFAGDVEIPNGDLLMTGDIEGTSMITERIVTKESWPNASVTGDLGLWTYANWPAPTYTTTPDGYRALQFIGSGTGNTTFTSPTIDLRKYALVDGVGAGDGETKTSTRVFLKCWINTQSIDVVGELLRIQFSPDNGSTWNTVYVDNSNEDTGTPAGWKMALADLSPYITATSTQCKVQFNVPASSVGTNDYFRFGRLWIHEGGVPTNLGGMWLGAGGRIGVGTTEPTYKLHVAGNAYVTSNLTVGTTDFRVDTSSNRVGVGITTPNSKLHVAGNAYVSSDLTVGTSKLFVNALTGHVGVGSASPNSNLHVVGNAYVSSNLTIGDSDLFVNALTGHVGIGSASPNSNLHVVGNAYVSSNLTVGASKLFVDALTGRVGVGSATPNSNLHVVGNAYVSSNLTVGASKLFVDALTGRVGIGSASPNSNVHVVGNAYVSSNLTVGGGVGISGALYGANANLEDVEADSVNITDTTASTSTTTGALKVAGGVGVAGSLNIGGETILGTATYRKRRDWNRNALAYVYLGNVRTSSTTGIRLDVSLNNSNSGYHMYSYVINVSGEDSSHQGGRMTYSCRGHTGETVYSGSNIGYVYVVDGTGLYTYQLWLQDPTYSTSGPMDAYINCQGYYVFDTEVSDVAQGGAAPTNFNLGTPCVITSAIGNVGIGTTSPDYTLDVSGPINLTSNIVMSGEVFVKAHDATKNYVAVGPGAGQTAQGIRAVAVGDAAGQTSQGTYAVAVGRIAGLTAQGAEAIAVGYEAGRYNQGSSAVAMGVYAGYTSQGAYAIAVGRSAGQTSQGSAAVAVGWSAGQISQGTNAVAVGLAAGQTSQGSAAVAVGYQAGQTSQGAEATAVGYLAGQTSQGSFATAVGRRAGATAQGSQAVAVGNIAGLTSQGDFAVAVGRYSARYNQGVSAVAVGNQAGETSQGESAVAVGYQAGETSQNTQAIAVGYLAGNTAQGNNAVAVGYETGSNNQGNNAVAVGRQAGATSQGSNAIAVGYLAGQTSQGTSATALGYQAGETSQSAYATALGVAAGRYNQGSNAVAVGRLAGYTNQHGNTVVLNATGSALDTEGTGRTYIKPLRVATVASNVMTYDQTTGEVMDSGGLISNKFAVVSEQPPSALTGATTTIQGHGKYVVTSSKTSSGDLADWNIFNKVAGNGIGDAWSTGTGYYDSNGTHIGDGTLGGVGGEWLKLEMPYKTKLRHISLTPRSTSHYANMPEVFTILGSNDDSSWTTLKALTGQTWTSPNDVKYVIDASASYKYYAIVVEEINENFATIGELRLFTESFSVDGGIMTTTAASGLETGFTEHPVAPIVFDEITGVYTSVGKVWNATVDGHGTYEITASSFYTASGQQARPPWRLFNHNPTDGSYWQNGDGSAYNASSPYEYTGTTQFTTDVGGTRYLGHWVQIKVPYAITLSHTDVYRTPESVFTNASNRVPGAGVFLGSNDGENWYKLTEFSGASYASDEKERVNINATTPYQYYRFVITNIVGGNSQTTVNFNEWRLFSATGVTKMDNVLISGELAVHGGALQTSHIKWPKVPLKANESEGYVASASTWGDTDALPWAAFEDKGEYTNGISRPVWFSQNGSFSSGSAGTSRTTGDDTFAHEWIQIQLPQAIQLSYFNIVRRASTSSDAPKNGFMYASNDGVTWTKLVSYSDLTYTGSRMERIDVQSTTPYTYYRLAITTTFGSSSWVLIDELQLFESTLGVGTSATTAKLTVDGGLGLAKGSQVFAGSDVITEFPKHDRPLVKYPEVNMTAATMGGYTVSASSNRNDGTVPYKAFENINTQSWSSAAGKYDSSGVATGSDSFLGINGSYIRLDLPVSVKVKKIFLRTDEDSRPIDIKLYGYRDSWIEIFNDTDISYDPIQYATYTALITNDKYFSSYVLLITKVHDNLTYVRIGEIEYYGTEEGDESVDIVHRSIPNTPGQQQLAVYYEARDPNSYSFADSSNVYDLSGNGVTGTITGNNGFDAEYNAWVFDGSGDYVSGRLSNPEGDWSYSTSVWFKVTDLSVSRQTIFHIGTQGTDGKAIELRIGDSTEIYHIHWGCDKYYENLSLSENRWYHACMTYGGGGNEGGNMKLYLDGILLNYTRLYGSGNLNINADAFFVLGSERSPIENEFTGSIANFRVYGKVLNADQVRELYEYDAERFGHRQNLVALHKGNLGVGTATPAYTLDVVGDMNLTSNIVMSGEVFMKAHDATKNYVAIGPGAGKTAQGSSAVAVGYLVGQTSQGDSAAAVGYQAGRYNQGAAAVAVGNAAGVVNQGSRAVAVGGNAGNTSQSDYAVAVGWASGLSSQGSNAVAVGNLAGQTSQGAAAVAVGNSAGLTSQGVLATAVGGGAGFTTQGSYATAVGSLTGNINQGSYATALGREAGQTSQGSAAVAVGYQAGQTSQGLNAVAVGVGAGQTSQGNSTVAVGALAGQTSQGTYATAVGSRAGESNQGSYATALGREAGQTSQGSYATAVGYQAGLTSQGSNAVAVGLQAGKSYQGCYATAVGRGSGQTSQGINSVAIGNVAGQTAQRDNAVAVGAAAAKTSQGSYAVAMGYKAGETNQHDNTVVLNASGSALNTAQASSFYVKPVRGGDIAASALAYTSAGEIVEETGVHFDASGNVGIGTTSPDGILHINGYKTKFLYEYRFQDLWTSNNNQTFTIPVAGGTARGVMLVEAKVIQVAANGSAERVARVKGMISNYGVNTHYMKVLEGENVSKFETYIVTTTNSAAGTFTLKYQPAQGYQQDVVCRLYLKIWYGGYTSSFGALTRTDTGSNLALATPTFNSATKTFGGNVGIGTDSPTGKLQIRSGPSSINATNTASLISNAAINISSYIDNSDYLSIGLLGATYSPEGNNPSAYMQVQWDTTVSPLTSSLLLNPIGGYVGIGTTNPVGVNGGSRLEGSSATGFEYIATRDESIMDEGDFIGAYLFKNTDTSGTPPHYAGMSAKHGGTTGEMDLHFYSGRTNYEGDVPHMSIVGGNVGIGTTSPATYLHLSAKNSVPLETEGDFIGAHTLTEYLRFTSEADTGDINTISVGFKLGADDNSALSPDGRLDICANQGTTDNDSGNIPNKTIATFIGSGNVGIGVTNPEYTLDVNGSEWVRGNLHLGYAGGGWPYYAKKITSGINTQALTLDFTLNNYQRGGIVKVYLTAGVYGQATVATWSRKVSAFSWTNGPSIAETVIENQEQHSGNSITITMPSNGTLRITGRTYNAFSYPMMEVEVTYAGGVRG
jgi:hypothetical protein